MTNSYAKLIAALRKALACQFKGRALRGKFPTDGGVYAVFGVVGRANSLLYNDEAKEQKGSKAIPSQEMYREMGSRK